MTSEFAFPPGLIMVLGAMLIPLLGERQRLFAHHVLARLRRKDGRENVPMVGGGVHDGVEEQRGIDRLEQEAGRGFVRMGPDGRGLAGPPGCLHPGPRISFHILPPRAAGNGRRRLCRHDNDHGSAVDAALAAGVDVVVLTPV